MIEPELREVRGGHGPKEHQVTEDLLDCSFSGRRGTVNLTGTALTRAVDEALETLSPRYEQYLRSGDLRVMSPCIEVNEVFSNLVKVATAVYPQGAAEEALQRFSPAELQRVRDICYLGECAMEQFYVRTSLAWIERDVESALADVVQRADRRVATLLRRQGDLNNPALDPAELRRVERLRALLSPPGCTAFPYVDNYLLMTEQGEFPMVQRVMDVAGATGAALTFVGSGALDLTADMMLIQAQARGVKDFTVRCIEVDGESAAMARRLLDYKEILGIVEQGSKNIVLGDAQEVAYQSGGANEAPREAIVDVLMLASMLPQTVKEKVLARASQRDCDPVAAVFIRDAYGLVGELLYPPVDHRIFGQYDYVPTMVCHPTHQLENGFVGRGELSKTIEVSSEIVNSTWAAFHRSVLS